jgi:hypothetical protein
MNFRVGDRVYDRWWPWKVGKVVKVLKTRVQVQFPDRVTTYDEAHSKQFLRKER